VTSRLAKATVFLAILSLVALWEIYGRFSASPEIRWGYPSTLSSIIWEWVLDGSIWQHLWSTLSIAVSGLAVGAAIGVALAYTFHAVPPLGDALTPIMTWLNALPRILLVPLFIAVLGIGPGAKLAMVVAMTAFLFFFGVLDGLKGIDQRILLNARILGASERDVLFHVYLPSLNSWIIASLRPAIGFAFIGAIISEYLGATSGMGYLVDIAYGSDRYDKALAGMLIIFALAAILDLAVRRLEAIWFRETKQSKTKYLS
jgi:NitT/TauT family transport system permease protein